MRVSDLEGGADEIVDEIDLGTGHVHQRHRIDEHLYTVLLDDHVVLAAIGFELESVLEAGAAPAGNADAQGGFLRFLGEDLGDPARGAVCYGYGIVLRVQHVSVSRRTPNGLRVWS